MQFSDTPDKVPQPFAFSAAGPYINTIPVASQIGVTDGAASYTDGFPPLTFVDIDAGGAGPLGQDLNGLLKIVSAGVRWQQSGGQILYDAAHSTAIGGYPAGAILGDNTDTTKFWLSTADNNTSNPYTGGANWTPLSFPTFPFTPTGELLGGTGTGFTAVAVGTGLNLISGILTASVPGTANLLGSAAGEFTGVTVGTGLVLTGGVLSSVSTGATSGNCRLDYVGSTVLRLGPYNGNSLWINDAIRLIPLTPPVDLANTGLVANTFYYVYALMTGETITLEAVTTPPAPWINGVLVKTGDASRTLVGACYTDSGSPGIFARGPGKLLSISWYNRRRWVSKTSFTTDRFTTTVSPSWAELNTEIRCQFICWADEYIGATFAVNGQCYGSAGTDPISIATGVGIDSAIVAQPEATNGNVPYVAGYQPIGIYGAAVALTENIVHFATVLGGTDPSTTGGWNGTASSPGVVTLDIIVNG